MPLPDLFLALFALLATPGPTNTLMALAGAQAGLRRMGPFMLAEILAYLAVTVPLALVGASLFEQLPVARQVVAGIAALWVLWLAVRMWRLPGAGAGASPISARHVFVTTLLNPKALVIGLVLLPAASDLGPRIAALGVTILICATGWAVLGARAAQSPRASAGLPRLAACWLALLSLGLASTAVSA